MKWTGGVCVILWLVAGTIFSRCGGKKPDLIDTVATPIAEMVAGVQIAEDYYNQRVQLKTCILYRANEYQRIWLKNRRADKMFDSFVDEVEESIRYGFDPADYHIKALEKEVEALYDNRKATEDDISRLDIRITASFFLFTTHLLEGRIRYPGARKFLWKRGELLENDIALLLKMKSGSDLRKDLSNLHPTDPQYTRLQGTLEDYRKLEASDTFPSISPKLKLEPGAYHDAIPLVRMKLSLTDMKGKGRDTSRLYDEKLVEAVQKFQGRHGLKADGVLESATIGFLNQTIAEKIELIKLNLERLRWLPHLQGEDDEIVINVPEYTLRIFRNNHEKMKMRVVLGAEYTPTPIFHDTLKYIVFSPTWMIPKSIFEKEFLPHLRDDPGYFDPERFVFYKNGKETDPYMEPWSDDELDLSQYSVVEKPGDANSLGKVKFIMPNDFSIYLHDTPAARLFNRDERALSHGCIRLERPEEFAQYLLSGQKGWNKKKVKKAMQSSTPVQVDLEHPYPVYIVYRTAWVDDQGLVNYREDIYGHDKRQLAKL